MTKDIIDLSVDAMEKQLQGVEDIPKLGKSAKPFGPSDMAPAINQHPVTWKERYSVFLAKERAGYNHSVNESFEFLTMVVEDVVALENEMEVFGRATNVRGFLMLMQGHLHEHLGQAIAYARVNGAAPPWSR